MKLHEMRSLNLCANRRRRPLLRDIFALIKLAARRQEAALTAACNRRRVENQAQPRAFLSISDKKDKLSLTGEQAMLLDETYKQFVRGGANLDEENKAKLKAINEELSVLRLNFGEHVLNENNVFELVIEIRRMYRT